ncbi:MAG TPA: DUF2142 domain-containing protein [Candidatus Udaeobacter sp.]|nr:DUF2142 domain-containing protein [Candidatus Udaeobacter sp.]
MTCDAALTNRTERVFILLLCFTAALRVLIFSAAFPFFSNVDEDLHFDLITQYSDGRLPRAFDSLKDETLSWIVPYASPEFLSTSDQFPGAKFPPLWKQTGPGVAADIAATRAAWSTERNFESSQPPLYYALASVWWQLGQHLGLNGLQSLYWIRFLNGLLIALVVLLGYLIARVVAPERAELRLGVPLLLAFIPQNVFYALNNDVLSPVCFGGLLLCVLQWLRTNRPTLLLGALTGLAIASTYLTKMSNLPLIVVALVAITVKSLPAIRQEPRTAVIPLATLVLCAAIPIGTWIAWTKYQFGDLTGSATKITLLGWTRKPFEDWLQHPIFTPRGLWLFWSNLMASFWRGEVSWHGRPLSWGPADTFFAVSSLVLLGSAIVGLVRRSGLSSFQQQAIGIAILVFLAGVAFLALLSIQFDFGNSISPSRGYPYFTAGRLLSGALIPFAVAYVYGIAFLLRRRSAIAPLIAIGGLVGFLATSEMVIDHAVFASEHNWFHG